MQHKNPTLVQLGFFAVERERAHAVAAKERQKRKPKSVSPSGDEQNGRSDELAAAEVGISRNTVSRCKAIAEKGCRGCRLTSV